MLDKRLWTNIPYVIFGLLTCMALWQIVANPGYSPSVSHKKTVYTLHSKSSNYSYPMHLLPNSDYNQLIDLNFTFTTLSSVCDSSSLLLLVLVHSAPENFKKREILRSTWAQNDKEVKTVFVLGSVESETIQRALDEENRLHNDLTQGSYLDTYRNMTYKHVMSFKYAIYHCPVAKYILKTDDDVFVNMPSMKIFLAVDLSRYGASRGLFCTPRKNVKVERTYRSKWRVSFAEYRDKYYPTYCPGFLLLYTPDVVFDLYRQAQISDYFWIDDVLITGILAKRIGISHTSLQSLIFTDFSKPFLYGKPDLNKMAIKHIWNYVNMFLTTPKSVLKNNKL